MVGGNSFGKSGMDKVFWSSFNKEEKVNQIFNPESDYFTAVEIAKQSKQQFSVLSGAIMRNEVWNLPAGESFVAQFLKDANLDYLWKDTEGKGSLNLGFEHVLKKDIMLIFGLLLLFFYQAANAGCKCPLCEFFFI